MEINRNKHSNSTIRVDIKTSEKTQGALQN